MTEHSANTITPVPDQSSTAFWEGTAQHRLLIQKCGSCGAVQFYPRGHCMSCFELEPDWIEAKGTGTLHTFSIVHRTSDPRFVDDLPYAMAVVELDEGVRMTTNIVDTPLDDLRCDMSVKVVFREMEDGFVLPYFTAA